MYNEIEKSRRKENKNSIKEAVNCDQVWETLQFTEVSALTQTLESRCSAKIALATSIAPISRRIASKHRKERRFWSHRTVGSRLNLLKVLFDNPLSFQIKKWDCKRFSRDTTRIEWIGWKQSAQSSLCAKTKGRLVLQKTLRVQDSAKSHPCRLL